jgi:hypothetical protein
MAAAFRADRSTGKSVSLAGIPIFDAGKLKFVHSSQEELSFVFGMRERSMAKAAQPFAVVESRFRGFGTV